MSCVVNPDGTITCSDGDEDALVAASQNSQTVPQNAYVMGARVTQELLGTNAGMNVILLTDKEVASLLGKIHKS